ncbi:MAG TPA: HlyD family efflux transporter periplasmic adaptor subunit [Noviherbaspirillum sp.]|jgi:putative peptide zinc metalloprotease protein|uniref:HlyD family efflux transporter periplasmic adaptor subunit n=1 Tax=Noviherbaspirillum sp. TaxID=1926288 RepID=UPI002F94E1D0
MDAALASSPPPAPVLPALRQDLQLLPGPPHADGAPSWRVHDPVRNRFYELGWLEFEMLSRWEAGMEIDALCAAVAAETPLHPAADEAAALLAFLRHHQLVMADAPARETLRKRWIAARPPWWKQAIHHYLFFRVPLLHPDRFLAQSLPRVAPFFTRGFLAATLLAGLLGLYLATRQADALASSFSYFFSLEGLLYYGIAATFAKVIHELGHAYTAKRMGLRVPTMGVAFLVMWPMLYTDTGESWKLNLPSRRFAIAAAGMASELALAAWTTLAWALTPDGGLRSMFFLLATSTWVLTLAINASPFMRFDGYFLLSDALDMPNLHERSSALARNALRRRLFGLEERDTEPTMSDVRKRALIAFAYTTWIYRLVLFIGIALMVYHLFFKLLGIFLMAIEIGWFIVRPVSVEVKALFAKRSEWRLDRRAWLAVAGLLLLFLWLVPLSSQVSAPALLRAIQSTAIYPASPARVAQVHVRAGQQVAAGAPLLRLESPELVNRLQRARLRAAGLNQELARVSANPLQRERSLVLEEQLGEALADEAGAAEELARLSVTAPHAGIVRDMPPDLLPGRWVQARHPLLHVVAGQAGEIDAYVDEQLLQSVKVGDSARFYPELADVPVLRGTVVAVDPAAGRMVPPLLASPNGGELAATRLAQGGLVAHEALYRIRIRPDDDAGGVPMVVRGKVRLEAGWHAVLLNNLSRILSVLVREAGF